MVRLAMQGNDIPCRKHEIADSEGISGDYVEQILIRLKAAGLVESHRGSKGGFTINGSPESITVADVLTASEGPVAIAPCTMGECSRKTDCVTRLIWNEAEHAISDVLGRHTIAQLAERTNSICDEISGSKDD
jgi:Rrf2 family protein